MEPVPAAQNQTLGNYDGFNYLGLGMLLCSVAVAVVVLRWHRSSILKCLKTRFGLLFVVLCLTVFAVSNVITANGRCACPDSPAPVCDTAGNHSALQRASVLAGMLPDFYLLRSCTDPLDPIPETMGTNCCDRGIVHCTAGGFKPALLEKAGSFRPYSDAGSNLLSQQDSSLAALLDATEGRYQHLVALGPLKTTGPEPGPLHCR